MAVLVAALAVDALQDRSANPVFGMRDAHAQATVKRDDQWRYAFGAGASIASGNSDSSQLSFSGDAVRAGVGDKLSLNGKVLRLSGQGTTQSDQIGGAARYERDIGNRWYGFGELDALRDRPANVQLRTGTSLGLGLHLVQREPTSFDVFTGLGYLDNRYYEPVIIADRLRDNYAHVEYLIGEESRHRFTDTTSFHQKLTIYQNLRDFGRYRAVLDAGISVAIDNRFSLNATIAWRYNSEPGATPPGIDLPGVGTARRDLLFVTGLTLKFD
ncbi:MAG: YdiY family protein [Lautropia sp.]